MTLAGVCMAIIFLKTHDYIKRLTKAGVSYPHAEAHADALSTSMNCDIVTRADLGESVAALTQETYSLKTELKEDLCNLRTALKADISGLRTELKEDISRLKTELKQDIYNLSLYMNEKFSAID